MISKRSRDIIGVESSQRYTVYDIDEQDGKRFIAMEFLEGQKLSDTSIAVSAPAQSLSSRVGMESRFRNICEGGHDSGLI